MKLFFAALVAALPLSAGTVRQHSSPVCPATGLSEDKDCAKAATGCICAVTGWATWVPKSNCSGCRMRYNYSWSCTNPASSGATGTVQTDVGCDTTLTLGVSSCPCDGTDLITLGGTCGICPPE